jgi:hypothetical protein
MVISYLLSDSGILFFLVCLNYVYRVSPMGTYFSLLRQRKDKQKKGDPIELLILA